MKSILKKGKQKKIWRTCERKFKLKKSSIYKSNLIRYIVLFAKFFNEETINSVISILSQLIVLDKTDKNEKIEYSFSNQFINAGGMALFNRFNLLSKDNYEASSLIDSCNFLSLLVRSSKDFYGYIDSISPFNDISVLLNHPDAQLKAKVLNLIGNLCRHSSYFYKKLV
jgi:fused-like protein